MTKCISKVMKGVLEVTKKVEGDIWEVMKSEWEETKSNLEGIKCIWEGTKSN